jgi:hypothetical protein
VNFVKLFARLGVLAFAGLVLWSCAVVVEEDRYPRPLPPERPQMCTQQYDPVCAQRGDRRQTFGNACMAAAEGFRIVHPGECRAGRPPIEEPRFCTREYRPVCAVRGSRQQTFSNACMAEVEGFRVVHSGECRPQSGRPPSGGQQACTMEYQPVCAVRGNRMRTFGNACSANAEGWRIVRPGEC